MYITAAETELRRLFLIYLTPWSCTNTQTLLIWCSFPLVRDPQYKESSQIANINIVHDISATMFLNFVYERSNQVNSSDWPPLFLHKILTDIFGVFQLRSAIYISVRSYGLSNAFFSAFYSIEINNDLFLLVRSWKQRQQFIIPWKTASRHCSVQRLWLDVFHASTNLELKVSFLSVGGRRIMTSERMINSIFLIGWLENDRLQI